MQPANDGAPTDKIAAEVLPRLPTTIQSRCSELNRACAGMISRSMTGWYQREMRARSVLWRRSTTRYAILRLVIALQPTRTALRADSIRARGDIPESVNYQTLWTRPRILRHDDAVHLLAPDYRNSSTCRCPSAAR